MDNKNDPMKTARNLATALTTWWALEKEKERNPAEPPPPLEQKKIGFDIEKST